MSELHIDGETYNIEQVTVFRKDAENNHEHVVKFTLTSKMKQHLLDYVNDPRSEAVVTLNDKASMRVRVNPFKCVFQYVEQDNPFDPDDIEYKVELALVSKDGDFKYELP